MPHSAPSNKRFRFGTRPFKTTLHQSKFRRSVIVACTLLLASAGNVMSADWPQWRGPDRTGYAEGESLRDQLPSGGVAPVWQLQEFNGGNSGGWGSPVVSDHRVYVYAHSKIQTGDPGERKYPWLSPDKRVGMSDDEYEEYEIKRRAEDEERAKAFRFEQRLACLDLESGEVVWDKRSPGVYTRFVHSGTPCVANGKVFVLGPQRTAFCHDAVTGELIWERRLPGEFRDEYYCSSFVVSGDVALVACGPLYALDAANGDVLWNGTAKTEYGSHSSPVVWNASADTVAICNTSGGRTQGYRVRDGELLWELESGVGQSSPIVAGDLLLTYGSSRKSGLVAYQMEKDSPENEPSQVWQFRGAADSGSTPVVRGDHVFVQGEKRVAKVQLADGKRVWQTTLAISTPRYSSLIAVGDQVLYGWEGILSFDADSDRFVENYSAKIDSDRVLILDQDLRTKLKMDEIESSEGGLTKAESVWQKNAVRSGPLRCSTPAVGEGRLVVRLDDALVCYDLRVQ